MKHDIEFIEDGHLYLVDGVITPSITQLLKHKFGGMYDFVNPKTLSEAAKKGTAVHKAIEEYEKEGKESDYEELRSYKLLKDLYKWNTLDNELPVVLELDGEVMGVGTLDLLVEIDGKLGIGDIKRTSTLNKEYVAYQLNLYRMAYESTFEKPIEFLFALHLREDKRKYHKIPIKEDLAREFLDEVWDEIDSAE